MKLKSWLLIGLLLLFAAPLAAQSTAAAADSLMGTWTGEMGGGRHRRPCLRRERIAVIKTASPVSAATHE